MKIAVVSDIHANLPALQAVLADAEDADVLWNLGDTLGYGADPVACLDLVKAQQPTLSLLGNHDLAALGRLPLTDFNAVARLAAEWTGRQLDERSADILLGYPESATVDGVTVAHASPRSPVREYILTADTAKDNMAYFSTTICLVGHTHIASVFTEDTHSRTVAAARLADRQTVPLAADRKIINPGSVGQPRDGDPRAAYLILDPDEGTAEARRVEYDILEAQRRIIAAGLPAVLASRLAQGR